MRQQIGLLADESVKQEIIMDALKVLAAIEKKYNCKFELLKTKKKGQSNNELATSKEVKEMKSKQGNTLLSFGGELDF